MLKNSPHNIEEIPVYQTEAFLGPLKVQISSFHSSLHFTDEV